MQTTEQDTSSFGDMMPGYKVLIVATTQHCACLEQALLLKETHCWKQALNWQGKSSEGTSKFENGPGITATIISVYTL